MISTLKKKNKIKRELLSKIEWACSLNAIKLEHEMIFEGCLRIIEHTNLAYVEPHRVIIKDKLFLFWLKVNSWGETSEKCFTPAFLMGLNKTHKKWSKPTFLCNSNKPIA